VKKENGVNPFLTVMNYKISFKTWLKHSRLKAKALQMNKNDSKSSLESSKNAPIIVDVDIEEIVEYSSSEEEYHWNPTMQKIAELKRLTTGRATPQDRRASVKDVHLDKLRKSLKQKLNNGRF
jgi:hypothetical protein